MKQKFIDDHANAISDLAEDFQRQLGDVLSDVQLQLVDQLMTQLEISGGRVESTGENANVLYSLPTMFTTILTASPYFSTVQGFLSQLAGQIDEFSAAYDYYRTKFADLPEMFFSQEDRDIMARQVESYNSLYTSRVLDASKKLQQIASTAMGGIGVAQLIQRVNLAVSQLGHVEQIYKDQMTTFFRLIGNLMYSNLEAFSYILKYRYIGPRDRKNRAFCADLISAPMETYTRAQIDDMDNGQGLDCFNNCGGYGCRHWWELVEVSR